jgi:hypothetical protein
VTEPTRQQVQDWLAANPGRSQSDCIAALWPPLGDVDRRRVAQRIRVWVHRERKKQTSAPRPPRGRPPQSSVVVPPASPTSDAGASSADVVAMVASDRASYYAKRLDLLLNDIERARAKGMLGLVPQLERRAAETRASLDEARAAEAAQGVKLDRSPKAVASELRKHLQLLDMLAEAGGEG